MARRSPSRTDTVVSSASAGAATAPSPAALTASGAKTTLLTGDTSTSGLTYASDGVTKSPATIFNLIINSGTTSRNPLGIPIDGPPQTVSITLDLCSATWDTIVTLVRVARGGGQNI